MKILRNKEYEDLQRERNESERREFDLRKRLIHACKKNEELKLTNEDLVSSNNTLILKNKNLEALIEDKEKSVKQWSARLGGLTKYNNKLKEDNQVLSSEISNLNENISKLTSDFNQRNADNTILAKEVINLRKQLKKSKEEKEVLQASLVKLNEKVKILSSSKNVKNYLRREEIRNESN